MRALFRCDASSKIGAGHVVRCLALAEALAHEGWSCSFVCVEDSAVVVPALRQAGHELVLLQRTEADDPVALRDRWPDGYDLLIVDHYELDFGFEAACRGWASRILVLDDLADRKHDCDLLLDSALDSSSNNYASLVPSSCRLLFGPCFAPLRPEFYKARALASQRRAERAGLTGVLLGFGASDTRNLTPPALVAIAQSGLDVRVDVVIGAGAKNLEEVEALSRNLPLEVRIFSAVNDMVEKMCEVDLAVGGAGSSAWERCCLGLPAIMIVTSKNQKNIAKHLTSASAADVVSVRRDDLIGALSIAVAGLEAEPARLREMSRRAFALCDGRGAVRVAEAVA
jgi:UDP-2,4-diacetamido-2,4,6-trideoxy-beta-L-altropyranose hydrolase